MICVVRDRLSALGCCAGGGGYCLGLSGALPAFGGYKPFSSRCGTNEPAGLLFQTGIVPPSPLGEGGGG